MKTSFVKSILLIECVRILDKFCFTPSVPPKWGEALKVRLLAGGFRGSTSLDIMSSPKSERTRWLLCAPLGGIEFFGGDELTVRNLAPS